MMWPHWPRLPINLANNVDLLRPNDVVASFAIDSLAVNIHEVVSSIAMIVMLVGAVAVAANATMPHVVVSNEAMKMNVAQVTFDLHTDLSRRRQPMNVMIGTFDWQLPPHMDLLRLVMSVKIITLDLCTDSWNFEMWKMECLNEGRSPCLMVLKLCRMWVFDMWMT